MSMWTKDIEFHGHRSHSSRMFAGFAFASVLSAAIAGSHPPRDLTRTLTTAREVHTLSVAEAALAYPVRFRAVVTYYDPYIDARHAALFVHDSTGCVFVSLRSRPAVPPAAGTLVEITGVSAHGDFAPIVDEAAIQVVGISHVPIEAKILSLTQLVTGAYDGQWVQVEGVVHSVATFGENVNLDIAMSDGSVSATTLKQRGVEYSRLIDAKVRIHANEAPVFNRHLQMTGVRLFFPDVTQVKVEEAAVQDPFARPPSPIDQLLGYTPNIAFRHRVHVRGRVTLQWPGRSLCIQESARGLCVQTAQTTRVVEGDVVDLVGFPAIDGLTPTLADATFRLAGRGEPVPTSPVTAEEALGGEYDARLVQIEGKLIGKDRAAKDPTMVLASGKFLFPVVLPNRSLGKAIPAWAEGSVMRISGICSVKLESTKAVREGFSVPASFRILLRSPQDVVVVEKPSWWTAGHLLPVLAAVLAITLGVLGWVVVLTHRVSEQTAVIRKQNAALKDLSFQDGLTRIANRRKFDETLDFEFRAAAEAMTPISLLMMDIDHFKALNDEYGHQRGDECLIRVARALVSASVRKTDLVARYGGEEFAVILPGCNETDAIAIAERMRAAVLDLAIANRRSPFDACVSISVGVATSFPGSGIFSAALIGLADQALYQSKLLGRNRTTMSSELTEFQSVPLLSGLRGSVM